MNMEHFRSSLERLPIVCGPVPGESPWSRQYSSRGAKSDLSPILQDSVIADPSCLSSGSKRHAEIDLQMNSSSKFTRTQCAYEDYEIASASSRLHETAIDSEQQRCLVKLHDVEDGDFRINDIFEFVGIFYGRREKEDPHASSGRASVADLMDMADLLENPIDSFQHTLATLHCITFRRVGSSFPLLRNIPLDNLPVLANRNSSAGASSAEAPVVLNPSGGCHLFAPSATEDFPALSSAECSRLRNILRDAICTILLMDDLAAEYLLLALLSKVYATQTGSPPLGFLSVGLMNMERSEPHNEVVKKLLKLFQDIMPLTSTIDAANCVGTVPRYDAETNLYSLSSLQLGRGTLLAVDERSLLVNEQLGPLKKESIACLASVVDRLSLPFRSDYCSLELPLDLSVVVFSHSTSVFEPLISCPWRPITQRVNAPSVVLNEPDLAGLRHWWANTRLGTVSMSSDTISMVENDFVNARQVDNRLSAQDFHIWLSLARMIAISYGNSINVPILLSLVMIMSCMQATRK